MPELSLKNRIVRYLRSRQGEYIHKGDLEREAILAGYLADNCARRLRELCADGFIEKREDKNGSTEYKACESTLMPVD